MALVSINPATGEEIRTYSEHSEQEIQKILEIRASLSPESVKSITTRIMEGELSGHEFDNNQLRLSLSSLVPEYEPLAKDQVDPVILKVKPEIQA